MKNHVEFCKRHRQVVKNILQRDVLHQMCTLKTLSKKMKNVQIV